MTAQDPAGVVDLAGLGFEQGAHLLVQRLQAEMDGGRRHRPVRLGFPDDEAAELSALHTRNFMQPCGR